VDYHLFIGSIPILIAFILAQPQASA
jgi:hypothetical protein